MTTSIGPGPSLPVADPQRDIIRATFIANQAHPEIVMALMTQFGVDEARLSNAVDDLVNVTHYLRAAGAVDGFGGLKVWAPADVHQFEHYYGVADTSYSNIWVQDALDVAHAREATLIGVDLSPWHAGLL